jgi:hypothetical protein
MCGVRRNHRPLLYVSKPLTASRKGEVCYQRKANIALQASRVTSNSETHDSTNVASTWPAQSATRMETEMLRNSTPAPEFPNCYFLDPEMFAYHDLKLTTQSFATDQDLNHAVRDPFTISTAYFGWVHLWMPIVSKRRWYDVHVKPLAPLQGQIKMLLLWHEALGVAAR